MAAMAALALLHARHGRLAPLILLGTARAGMNMAIWALLALSVQAQASVEARLEALPVGLFLAVLKCASRLGNSAIAALVGGFSRLADVAAAALALPMIGCAAVLLLLRAAGK